MNKRYDIRLDAGWETGVHCVHVEVRTRTRQWGNGPILTEMEDFSYLEPGRKRLINGMARESGGFDELLKAVEEGQVSGVDPVEVRMVRDGCRPRRPYLYVSVTDEFLSERDLVAYAKENSDYP